MIDYSSFPSVAVVRLIFKPGGSDLGSAEVVARPARGADSKSAGSLIKIGDPLPRWLPLEGLIQERSPGVLPDFRGHVISVIFFSIGHTGRESRLCQV